VQALKVCRLCRVVNTVFICATVAASASPKYGCDGVAAEA
jgi:hypothetical protein